MTIRKKSDDSTARLNQNKELIRAVHKALHRYDPIRSSDSPIDVTGSDDTVTLTGVVRSRTMKVMAETLARRVPGVTNVRNQLLTDTDIETAVALELAMQDGLRQADSAVRVKSILGTVYLSGDIAAGSVGDAEELKKLAESVAKDVPGVSRVINGIVARERGQVLVAVAGAEQVGGPSAEAAAKLAELRERRAVWAERAGATG